MTKVTLSPEKQPAMLTGTHQISGILSQERWGSLEACLYIYWRLMGSSCSGRKNDFWCYDAAVKIWFNQFVLSCMFIPSVLRYTTHLTFTKNTENSQDAVWASKHAHPWKHWHLNPIFLMLSLYLATILSPFLGTKRIIVPQTFQWPKSSLCPVLSWS